MNKKTSNDIMEREFDILQSIKGMNPPADLYNKVLAKTNSEVMTVTKKWLAGAAAMLTVLICMEIFFLIQYNQNSKTSEVEILVQKEKYQLYE